MTPLKRLMAAALLAVPVAPAFSETPDDTLVVAQNIDDIVTIDPATAYEFSSAEYAANAYDQLVRYDATDTEKLVPWLATGWTLDEVGPSVTFVLRDGVTFHSGNPLRAEDVVGSWKRVVVLNQAPAAVLGYLGWNAENIDQMAIAEGNTVKVSWVGDLAPSFVLNVLATVPASVVDMQTVLANEVDGDQGTAWLNRNSAGTGPFKLREFRPAELLALETNADYFADAPAMQQVIIRHVPEAATQRLLLESGDVDMAMNLTPDQVAGLSGTEGVRVETFPQSALHWFSFNQKVESLTNPAVWEAARYLVDYEGMAASFLKGQMDVHQAFWPEGFPSALNDTPFHYDPEKAKQILAEAGVELPITVTLDVINSAPFTDIATSLQQTFAPAGINFEILPGSGSQVITKYRARTHEAMLLYWAPDFVDPHSNASSFAFNADNSDDKYVSTTTWRNAWMPPAEINAMTQTALTERDPAKREAMYLDLQRAMQAESPYVIMFQAQKQVAMADDVRGFVNGANPDLLYYRLVTKN